MGSFVGTPAIAVIDQYTIMSTQSVKVRYPVNLRPLMIPVGRGLIPVGRTPVGRPGIGGSLPAAPPARPDISRPPLPPNPGMGRTGFAKP